MSLRFYWRVFYEYAKADVDACSTNEQSEGEEAKCIQALKSLKTCCEQLAAFDLEKFEDIEE